MNLCAFAFAALVLVGTAMGQPAIVAHDQVKPFPQPDPVTISEKAALKFKPQLSIAYGCHPYPAVQADGSVSAGLEHTGKADGGCKGSGLGSQVTSYSAVDGHRHAWGYLNVWIDHPAAENARILGVSMSGEALNNAEAPLDTKFVDGTSVKVRMDAHPSELARGKQGLRRIEDAGEFQDLITWNQLTVAARDTFNNYDFDSFDGSLGIVPFRDETLHALVNATWPFDAPSVVLTARE